MTSPIQLEDVSLRAQDMDADLPVSAGQQLLPLLHSIEDEWHKLSPPELSTAGIDPDHRFRFLRTKEDHVVVRGDDDLIGRPSVGQHVGVG